MTPQKARFWLVHANIATLGGAILTMVAVPACTVTLSFPEALQTLETIAPVFVGNLGTMVTFLWIADDSTIVKLSREKEQLLASLVRLPVFFFVLAFAGVLAAFLASQHREVPDTGMKFAEFHHLVTIALGVVTAVTNALVTFLFTGRAPASNPGMRNEGEGRRVQEAAE